MFKFASITQDHTLQLPTEIANQFQPTDRFIIWMEGDTLHLKRINPSPLKVIENSPDDEPLSLDEINEIVHEVRQQKLKPKVEI